MCSAGCFLGWGDMIGVAPGNPKCTCGVATRREGGVYACANEKVDCGWKWREPGAETGEEMDYEIEVVDAGSPEAGSPVNYGGVKPEWW